MDILTLLKANIRKKTGTFISILLLTAIISAVMTTIFSVRDNYTTAIHAAVEYADCGEVLTIIRKEYLSDELREAVANHPLVERVLSYDAIYTQGLSCNGNTDESSQFLLEMRDGIRVLNENLNGYRENIPELQSGEIYLPLCLKSLLACDIGDTITVSLLPDTTAAFTIKGFVEEITLGSMEIGWKQLFISHADYVKLLGEDTLSTASETMAVSEATLLMLYKAADCDLSDAQFQRQLNLDTGIISSSMDAYSRELSLYYTTLRTDTVLDFVIVFALLLFLVVPLVISHSIETEIEIEYPTLGILKAQGFTPLKIRVLFILQYLLAQLGGILVGSLTSIPLERGISRVCMNITGILPVSGLSLSKYLLFAGAILLVSILLILLKTRKISKISPVIALSVGHEEIYFDHRIRLPLCKKCLSASISLRQLTTTAGHYIGTVCVVALLTFCMITTQLIGNMLSSRTALDAMGLTIPDIYIYYSTSDYTNVKWKYLDAIVEEHTEITKKNSSRVFYATLNGEELSCEVYEFPEYISGILRGRAPLYDNEIMVTEAVADLLDIQMGDEVNVCLTTGDYPFLVSGIYQSRFKSGRSFLMSFEGAERMGANLRHTYRYYIVEDRDTLEVIADEMNSKYGDLLDVEISTENSALAQYGAIITLLKLLIYSFSLLFSFVVVRMVCTQSFLQERTNIGIYKALGFTPNRLRLQFAVRFLIVAIIGSLLGVLLSTLLSERLLGTLFSAIGISKLVLEYTASTLLLPIGVIAISFFVFAYASSGKIKSVSVRELVTE